MIWYFLKRFGSLFLQIEAYDYDACNADGENEGYYRSRVTRTEQCNAREFNKRGQREASPRES